MNAGFTHPGRAESIGLLALGLVGSALAGTWVVRSAQSNPPGVSVAPSVLGMDMHILVPPPGPAFYLTHAWVWANNPAGMFADWNPKVSCA